MSIRILGGTARGRAIAVPESARPSGVRVRKSLFDLLAARQPSGRFLDLHGGSGAVALEAASRGYLVTVLEQDMAAVRTLTANARALDLRPQIIHGDARSLLAGQAGRGRFDSVFSDPPYGQDIAGFTDALLLSEFLEPGGMVVAQHPVQLHLPDRPGYVLERRVYGSNALSLYTSALAGEE